MEALVRLKACGNAEFSKNTEAGYRQACVIYGQVLQCMIALESSEQQPDDDATDDASASSGTTTIATLGILKPTIFLNLAAANLHLGIGGLEGCHRCCNAAVVFINNPHLLLDELGQDDDSDVAAAAEIRVLEPVAPQFEALATKALYRRGRCLMQMGAPFLDRARCDLETALRLATPRDQDLKDSWLGGAASNQQLEIQRALRSIIDKEAGGIESSGGSSMRHAATGTTVSAVSEGDENSNSGDGALDDAKSVASAVSHISGAGGKRRSAKTSKSFKIKAQVGARKSTSPELPLPAATLAGMQSNGGLCLRRRGMWSQSMGEATVFFSLSELLSRKEYSQEEEEEEEEEEEDEEAAGWSASFTVDTITISKRGQSLLHALLEYNVRQAECLWTLEAFGTASTSTSTSTSAAPSHLVLYLQKAPSVEWFPGCEWWDRVFIDDEPIDTSTCCLAPSELDQLPNQARDRAQQHLDAFARLDSAQRGAELDLLSHAKKELFDAAQALQADERANNEANPGREEMLDALRAEFPSIFFGSK